MTEDSPDTVLDDDALNALLERPLTELSVDELMAMKAAYAARGTPICNSVSTDQVILAFLALNVCQPFLQTLSQRAANAVADLPGQVARVIRKHVKRQGQPDEIHMSLEDGAIPWIALTANMTDEAWLALFEMDIMAEELRGKVLRWDEKAGPGVPMSPRSKQSACHCPDAMAGLRLMRAYSARCWTLRASLRRVSCRVTVYLTPLARMTASPSVPNSMAEKSVSIPPLMRYGLPFSIW